MCIVLCPGFHPPALTQSFLMGLGTSRKQIWVLPLHYPPYSAIGIWRFLNEQLRLPPIEPLTFIAFSAGVVGAAGAAVLWQKMGGSVSAFIAVDGWGVPLWANFPIHRLSHDPLTHWSSSLLGGGEDGFYADPEVSHLELWRSPQRTQGWWVRSTRTQILHTPITAAQYLNDLLDRYSEE